MKSLKFIFAFMLYSLVFTNLLLAGEYEGPPAAIRTTTASTANGFDRNKFCEEGAKAQIKELNEKTKKTANDLAVLQNKINDLENQKQIINELKRIVSDYVSSASAIQSDRAIKKNVQIETLNNFKKTLNNALILEAVSAIATENTTVNKDTPRSMASFCLDKSSSSAVACDPSAKAKDTPGLISSIVGSNRDLDITLTNFQKALNLSANSSADLNSEIKKIYRSIPDNISPDKVLKLLSEKAPNFSAALNSANNGEEILKCLNGNNAEDCRNLIDDPAKRANMQNILKKEFVDFSTSMSDTTKELDAFRTKLASTSLASFDEITKSYDDPTPKGIQNTRVVLDSKTKRLKELSESLYRIKNPDGKDPIKNGFDTTKFDDVSYSNLITNCTIDTVNDTKFTIQNEKLEKCLASYKDATQKLATVDISNEELEQTLKAEYQGILDSDGFKQASFLESMKQFIADKYIRGCPETADQQTKLGSNFTCIKLPPSANNITDFGKDVSSVIGRLQTESLPSKTREQDGIPGYFAKSELYTYQKSCMETTYQNTCGATCKNACSDINNAINELRTTKTNKEWSDFNNKYWVTYNPKAKNGYDVYEKKSNLRIFGEGLSQSVKNIFPIWSTNLQLNGQIDLLTNQAMYSKQLNYMYSPTSPWATSNYFQGNYFGNMGAFNMSNPFLNNTINTNGFNFSK